MPHMFAGSRRTKYIRQIPNNIPLIQPENLFVVIEICGKDKIRDVKQKA